MHFLAQSLKLSLFANPNEDLHSLLQLNADELFSKYEQIITPTSANSDRIKLDTMIETLSDVKEKLRMQRKQNELYENQHHEMMAILKIPFEQKCFANILPAIKNLQESYTNLQEHELIEIDNYSNAQNQLSN